MPEPVQPIFPIAAVIVVVHNDHILVSLRSATSNRQPGKLQYPGGKKMDSESAADSAVRELREETGLVCVPCNLNFLYAKTILGYEAMFYAYCIYGAPPVLPANPEPLKHTSWEWTSLFALESGMIERSLVHNEMVTAAAMAIKLYKETAPVTPPTPKTQKDLNFDRYVKIFGKAYAAANKIGAEVLGSHSTNTDKNIMSITELLFTRFCDDQMTQIGMSEDAKNSADRANRFRGMIGNLR